MVDLRDLHGLLEQSQLRLGLMGALVLLVDSTLKVAFAEDILEVAFTEDILEVASIKDSLEEAYDLLEACDLEQASNLEEAFLEVVDSSLGVAFTEDNL